MRDAIISIRGCYIFIVGLRKYGYQFFETMTTVRDPLLDVTGWFSVHLGLNPRFASMPYHLGLLNVNIQAICAGP